MILKNKLKKIIEAIEDTDITTIEISSFWGAQKIKLCKDSKGEHVTVANQDSVSVEPMSVADTPDIESLDKTDGKSIRISPEENLLSNEKIIKIKAPLVGTFYLSPKPGEPQFVNIGDKISIGQSICIVEAMKIFNEIESDYSGEIVDILVNDGDPIEYDQVLFALKSE